MAYQSRHLNSDEILSIGSDGLIVDKTKRQLKNEFDDLKNPPDNNIARFSDI